MCRPPSATFAKVHRMAVGISYALNILPQAKVRVPREDENGEPQAGHDFPEKKTHSPVLL